MPARLAALRRTLDLMPSPVEEHPGLLLRDPFGYTQQVLIVPPPLVPYLAFFDGAHDDGQLAEALVRATGDPQARGFARRLALTLADGGFLEGEELERRRAERHRAFAEASRREPALAGQAYPEDASELRAQLEAWLREPAARAAASGDTVAIAAPHVSPEGGHRSYAAAYSALAAGVRGDERTFVVLGTSHYGPAERFGVTRKAYETPYGATTTDPELVGALIDSAGEAAILEDYCHAVEHSIEFQVLFLQHVYGPQVRVVPVLCGPFARATRDGGFPEDDPGVAKLLEGLRRLSERAPGRLAWVLGVDLAHVGRRYGDELDARAFEGPLAEVERRDRERLACVQAGDARGFWATVRENGDDLSWCGASALYTFLHAAGPVRGELLRYEQWNIDPASVVSFAALAFSSAAAAAGHGES